MLRDDKGYSVLASRDTYTALDLETTGLDPQADMIIEIGAIRIRNGAEVERYHQLVNPVRPIPPVVTDITGITDDMVADQPTVEEVLPAFISWLSDDLILGHNVNFDVNFLYDASVRITGNPVTNDFLDTMRLARYLYPEEKHNRLIDLVNRFGIGETQTHRALDDVEQTIACYEFMRKRISDEGISMPANEGRRSGSASIFRGEDNLLQIAPSEEVTPDPAFDGRTFVFTGALKRMTRENAQRAVSNLGGVNGKGVTKSTNYLVTGSTDYNAALKGAKSSKWLKAEKLQASGQDIHIISEDVFYDMLGDSITEAPTASDCSQSKNGSTRLEQDWQSVGVCGNEDGFLNAKTKRKELSGSTQVIVDSHPLQRSVLDDYPEGAKLWVCLKNVTIDGEDQISVTINGGLRVGKLPDCAREKYAPMIPTKNVVSPATIIVENGTKKMLLKLP